MSRVNIIGLAVVALLIAAALAVAQICPTTPDGYIRQPRPQGEPANYPPTSEPACFIQGTNYVGNYLSCTLCHYYMWRNAA